MPTLITTGAVTVAAGSLTVTGIDTDWLLSAANGGTFYCQGMAVPIATVNSNTSITLYFGFPGLTGTAVAYAIDPVSESRASLTAALANMASAIRRLEAGTWLQPNATGTLAQRAAYDGSAQGFVYARTDVAND